MVLSIIITKVKASLVCPTIFPVTAGFSTAPQVRAFTIIRSIQRDMTPSLTILLSLLPWPIPAPHTPLSTLKTQNLWTCLTWFLFKISPPFFPYHYTFQKSILTESTSSPHTHSLSHSRLASFPTPPLKLPSLGHRWLSSLISGLTLLILCCNRHLYLLSETSYSWCPSQYLLLPLCSSPDSCPNFIIYTYQSSSGFYPQTQFLPFPILWILLR